MTDNTILTLDRANLVVAKAIEEAVDMRIRPISAVVLDSGGHLVSFQRQDRTPNFQPMIAIAKASGALGLGISSRRLGELATERPTFVSWLSGIAPHGVVPAAGGLLLIGAGNNIVGAVGVSGDTPDNDEICAIAGLTAAGFEPAT